MKQDRQEKKYRESDTQWNGTLGEGRHKKGKTLKHIGRKRIRR